MTDEQSSWDDTVIDLEIKVAQFSWMMGSVVGAMNELLELHQLVVFCSEPPLTPTERSFVASNAKRVSEGRRLTQQMMDELKRAAPAYALIMRRGDGMTLDEISRELQVSKRKLAAKVRRASRDA